MITARSIKPHELDRAGEIGAEAFEMDVEGWIKSFERHYHRFGGDYTLVVEHGGQLVAAMMITPEGLQMGGTAIPGGAVGGVGTVVSARRLGCAAAMMTETVRRMKACGIAGSAMWPFSFAYYRKFGWETGGEVRITRWPRDVAWIVPPDGEISTLSSDDSDDVEAVWKAVAPRNRCSTVRTSDVWAHTFRSDGYGGGNPRRSGIVCRRGGKPVGYLMYELPEPKEGAKPELLEVGEFRALDAPAAIALIQALTERTDFPKYLAAFSIDDRLRALAVNARDVETELHASFGFRIVNPGAILPLMLTEAPAEPVIIRVGDELVGTHTWKATLDGAPAGIVPSEPDVECDIRAFTQMASGYLKPVDAATLGLLKGDAGAIARLQAATRHWRPPFRSGMEEG